MSGKQLLVLRELLYLTKRRISWFISKNSWLQPENDRFARKQDGLTSNSYSWLQFKSILSMFLIHFLNISKRHMKNFLVPPVLSSSFPKLFLKISTISIFPNFSSIFPTYNPIFPVACFQYSPQISLILHGIFATRSPRPRTLGASEHQCSVHQKRSKDLLGPSNLVHPSLVNDG